MIYKVEKEILFVFFFLRLQLKELGGGAVMVHKKILMHPA